MARRRDAFHRLIKGQIQRIAGRGGDHGVDRFLNPLQHHFAHERHPLAVRLFRMAGEDLRDFAVACERDIDQKIVPCHSRNFDQFAMQRVVLHGPFHRPPVAHELRAMQDFDRLLRRQSWGNQLPSPGKAQHQMRLNEAKRDVQIGCHEPLVDVDRRAGGSIPQEAMLAQNFGVVVDHANIPVQIRPDDLPDFVFRRRPVQPGGDQDDDILAGNPALFQSRQQRRQHQPVRRGPRDIADRYGRRFLAPRQSGERLDANRRVHGRFQCGHAVGERHSRARL